MHTFNNSLLGPASIQGGVCNYFVNNNLALFGGHIYYSGFNQEPRMDSLCR